MDKEQMMAAGISEDLINLSQKGKDTVSSRINPNTEVLDEAGEVIEKPETTETPANIETPEESEAKKEEFLEQTNDVSDDEVENGGIIEDTETTKDNESAEGDSDSDYSLQKLYDNMESNEGKLSEEMKGDLKSRFEKAGIPAELVDRLEKLEQINANNEVKDMLSVLGTKEERQATFEWAKTNRGEDRILDSIVKTYNEAAKGRDIDRAKEYATLLKEYHNKQINNESNVEEAKKPKITLTGHAEKAKAIKSHYESKDELNEDLRRIAKGDKDVDFNDIVNKAFAKRTKR